MLSFILLCLSCLVLLPSIILLYKNPSLKGRYILLTALVIQTIICCWSDISTSYNRKVNIEALRWDFFCIFSLFIPSLLYFLYINNITNFLRPKTIFIIAAAFVFLINSFGWKRYFPILSKKGHNYDLVNINHTFWHILVGYVTFNVINSNVKK